MTLARTLGSWRSEIEAYASTGGASNAWAEAVNHLIKNQKRQAHGYNSWAGFRGQMLWCFATEVVDPATGEITALRLSPGPSPSSNNVRGIPGRDLLLCDRLHSGIPLRLITRRKPGSWASL